MWKRHTSYAKSGTICIGGETGKTKLVDQKEDEILSGNYYLLFLKLSSLNSLNFTNEEQDD